MSFGSNSSSSSSRPLTGPERASSFGWGLSSMFSKAEDNEKANGWGRYFQQVAPGYSSAYTRTMPDAERLRFTDPGEMSLRSSVDYDRLEQSIIESRLAPLRQFEQRQREALDQSLADRGIYSSGLAVEAQNDLSRELAPTISQAANEAVTTRYGFEQGDNQSANQYQLGRSGMLNEFNLSSDRYGLDRANLQNQYGLARAGMLNEQDLARSQARDQYALGAQSANLDRSRYLADAALQERQGRLDHNFRVNQDYNDRQQEEAMRRYNAAWRPLDFMQGLWNQTGGAISTGGGSGWEIGI